MNEGDYVSKASVIAWLFWGKAVALVVIVWAMAIEDIDRDWLIASTITTALSIAVASVWHIRLFSLRLCALLRVSSGLQRPDAEIHSIDRC